MKIEKINFIIDQELSNSILKQFGYISEGDEFEIGDLDKEYQAQVIKA